jgi:SHS2 domain-containing protein
METHDLAAKADEAWGTPGGAVCRLFAHTADLGLRITAGDVAELMRAGALGLVGAIGDLVPRHGAATRTVEVTLTARDAAELLRDWLAEVLYLVDHHRVTVVDVALDETTETSLRARVEVAPYDEERSVFLREVKAVTYHGLRAERTAAGWIAEVIVDI